MGPLSFSKTQVRGQPTRRRRRHGADAKRTGKIDSDTTFASGYFMRPTLVTNIDDGAPLPRSSSVRQSRSPPLALTGCRGVCSPLVSSAI
jgi:hypothetical protein